MVGAWISQFICVIFAVKTFYPNIAFSFKNAYFLMHFAKTSWFCVGWMLRHRDQTFFFPPASVKRLLYQKRVQRPFSSAVSNCWCFRVNNRVKTHQTANVSRPQLKLEEETWSFFNSWGKRRPFYGSKLKRNLNLNLINQQDAEQSLRMLITLSFISHFKEEYWLAFV